MATIFTDGAARGNPGPGGWGAIVQTHDSTVELGGREEHTTNNRMELTAIISALESSLSAHEITLYTDSSYVLSGITRWVKGWQKNKWKTSKKEDVLNKDLWEKLVGLTTHRVIDWKLVKGHSGTAGNERCDIIATSFADGNPTVLYNGSRERYGIDVSIKEINPSTKLRARSKAYSYISMVDDIVQTHKTWEECKSRVHGVPNAKYKKSTSQENEEEIIREFAE